jgi:tetratricopeptide (TPR) repeat protein
VRSMAKIAAVLLALGFSCATQAAQSDDGSVTPGTRAHRLFVSTSLRFLKDLDRQRARKDYRRVVQIDGQYAPAWFNLGVLAEADYDWPEAKADFKKYLTVAPEGAYSTRAARELNVIAARSKQPVPTPAQQYDAAIHRARTLLAAKFYKESIAEAADAQSLDDSRWEAYAIVSICMARQHKIHEAVEFQNLALDRTPVEARDKVFDVLTRVASGGPQQK